MNRKRLPKALTPSEAEAFRSVVSNPRDRAMMGLQLDAGCRASEVSNMKLQNIIWDGQCLRFAGKGGKEAEIPINSRLKDALEAAIRERPPQAIHSFLLWDLKNPSKPITRFAIYKLVRSYARKAGIQRNIHPHMLRHTFGTEYYRATGDLGKVQKALRHSKPETSTIYTHLSVDDQRKDFEAIDKRPWLLKLWSRLKPNVIPELLKPRPKPFYIGETIGREKEITALRTAKRNTILIGDEGVGKKHLLKGLFEEKKKAGKRVYQLEEFSPARTALVGICEQLKADNLIGEIPKGRTSGPFIDTIRKASKEHQVTLIIYSLNDVSKQEIKALRKIAEDCVVFSSVNPSRRPKLKEIFFGNYQEIEIAGFEKKTAFEFASRAIADMNIPDKKSYLNRLYIESNGNPKALMELMQATRQTGELSPKHLGVQKVLSATPLLSVFVMCVVASRYSATALSHPDWKVYATILTLGMAPLIVLDKILKSRRK